MKRRLLHVLVALSAALCAWSLYGWVRSYWPEDLALRSYRGRMVVLATSGPFTKYNDKGSNFYRSTAMLWAEFHRSAQSQWRALGFAYAAADYPTGSYRLLAIPYPLVAVAAAALPAWWARHARRARRRCREGRCANCGYDLRESQGRCPECGSVPAAPAS